MLYWQEKQQHGLSLERVNIKRRSPCSSLGKAHWDCPQRSVDGWGHMAPSLSPEPENSSPSSKTTELVREQGWERPPWCTSSSLWTSRKPPPLPSAPPAHPNGWSGCPLWRGATCICFPRMFGGKRDKKIEVAASCVDIPDQEVISVSKASHWGEENLVEHEGGQQCPTASSFMCGWWETAAALSGLKWHLSPTQWLGSPLQRTEGEAVLHSCSYETPSPLANSRGPQDARVSTLRNLSKRRAQMIRDDETILLQLLDITISNYWARCYED